MTHYLTTMPTLGKTAMAGQIKMRRPLKTRPGEVPAEIVLAYLPHNDVTPYVTWQRNTAEYEGEYWGHYYFADQADEAVADFGKRGRR